MNMERHHPHISRGTCYVEFETHEEADKAIKYMDGGQIDGQEITVNVVLPLMKTDKPPIRRDRGGFRGGFRGNDRRRDRDNK